MKTPLVLLILAAGMTSLAAQETERPGRPDRPERPQRPNPEQVFKTADSNEDGYLDLAELTAFRETIPQGPRGARGPRGGANAEGDAAQAPETPQGQRGRGRSMPSAEDMLAMMDKNEDGKIAPDEFTLGRRGRGGPGGPGGGEGRRARPPQ